MEGIVIAVIALGGIIASVWSQRRGGSRDSLDLLGDGDERDLRRRLEASERERRLLAERVENLEAIVTDASLELNRRIGRLLERTEPPRSAPSTREDLGRAATLTADMARAQVAGPVRGELELGAVLDNRYRIERLLGRGGMGAVYLAHDEVLGERVALKVISSLIADDPAAMIARFRREAAAARRISSPNVVRIHDIGEADGGLVYISMEYVVGQTLARVTEARRPVPIDTARGLVGQICVGLSAAHQAGVIHRDLKPGNVLVGERDAVKIIDFGLAKSGFLDGMTATGLMLGTPAYMAPEQVKGLDVDERTDIYALGALAYFVVTGRPPFTGATPIAIGFAHCATPPQPPRELRPDLPPALEAAILAALEKDPARRPRSVEELRAALLG